MAEVYKAYDINENRTVAVKLFQEGAIKDAILKEAFDHELRSLRSSGIPTLSNFSIRELTRRPENNSSCWNGWRPTFRTGRPASVACLGIARPNPPSSVFGAFTKSGEVCARNVGIDSGLCICTAGHNQNTYITGPCLLGDALRPRRRGDASRHTRSGFQLAQAAAKVGQYPFSDNFVASLCQKVQRPCTSCAAFLPQDNSS
jgi:hypothetical protein